MNQDSIMKVLQKILQDHCGVDLPLHQGLLLQDDLGLDSIGLLTLAVQVENHFKIILAEGNSIPETVGDLTGMIQLRLQESVQHAHSS